MKICVFTLGCKVNRYESDSIITHLTNNGYEVTKDIEYADCYIINTCAVTQEAERKSRQAVARMRKYNPDAEIVVCGCASELDRNQFSDKGVGLIIGTKDKEKKILELFKNPQSADCQPDKTIPATSRGKAYIKVQDGCDNFCSYCIVPYLRGRSRSRGIDDIVKETEQTDKDELILVGINLSDYKGGLHKLLPALKHIDKAIELGSLEVSVITKSFLEATKQLKRFVPHFHLSLQSGSNKVIRDMNRKYSAGQYIAAVDLIRKYYPGAVITTDIIVGFPTETEEDFNDTIKLCEKIKFNDIHIFPYSPRSGTVAYKEYKKCAYSVKSLQARLNQLASMKTKT